jgi:hypothetical protein
VVVVVVPPPLTHRHAALQVNPGGHENAPPGELASHSSPGSSLPLPQSDDETMVVVVVPDITPLHSGGYGTTPIAPSRVMHSAL